MSDVRLLLRQTRWALLITSRIREAVAFTIVFPVVLLVFYNSIFGGESGATISLPGTGELSPHAYFTAAMVAYAITFTAYSTLAVSLVGQRETGQLKRLRGTPLPRWTFVVAQILRVCTISALLVTVLLAIGVLAFGVRIDVPSLARVALYSALGTATMAALGVALTTVTRNADAVSTLAPFTAVMLSFISGVFLPLEVLPDWLATVGSVFPLQHLASGLQRALTLEDSGLDPVHLLALAGWGAIGLIAAVRRLRWEPQEAKA